MLKVFRPEGSVYIGQDVDSWDRTWDHTSIQEALRWATICHLRPIFDRYFPRRGKILEGGCGAGQFVIYFRSLGYDIEGVDFSPLAISRIKAYDPTLPVRVGDVTDLPYSDGSIQCYYSGGVVEHFEEGPFAALAEARRVLSRDGRLLITVPFLNLLRRVQVLFGVSKRLWGFEQVVLSPRKEFIREAPPIRDYCFAEYIFDKREFCRILADSGFRIETILPCDLEWGELCQFLYRRFRKTAGSVPAATQPTEVENKRSHHDSSGNGLRALWKEFFVTENPRQPWLHPVLRILAEASGHMVLFVCRPIK